MTAELDAAEALLAVGRAEAARQRVAAALASAPDDGRALRLLARCHADLDDHEAMLAAAEAAVAAEPDHPTSHLLRASALLRLNGRSDAEPPHHPRGGQSAGRLAEALRSAEAAVALAPYDWWAHVLRGLALVDLPDRRREGFAALRHAVRLAPDEPQVHYVQGAVQHALGRRVKARQAYRRALRLDPQHAGAQEGLGHLALRAGRNATALRHFNAAAVADPSSPAAVARVERVLVNVAGTAVVAAFVTAFVLLFTAHPAAWAVAAALLGAYALACWRFLRGLPPGVRALGRDRLRRDPRLRVRAGAAALLLVAGVAVGGYGARSGTDEPAPTLPLLMIGLVATFAAAAATMIVVDVRHTRRDGPALGPEEHGEVAGARMMLRWSLAAALGATAPAALSIAGAGWGVRAVVGTACLAALVGYARWSVRRWRRHPPPPSRLPPPVLLPVLRLAALGLGLSVIYLVAAAYLPGRPPELFSALGVAVIGVTLLAATGRLAVRGAARLVRRGRSAPAP